MFVRERVVRGESQTPLGLTMRGFAAYALPAFCYFVSNNCMFYIIRHLGAATFQIMNNLKVLSTGGFMRVFLNRKLTWMQWKALIMLVIGCMVTQLSAKAVEGQVDDRSTLAGYTLVLVSAVASGVGGVFSEKLLKAKVTGQQKLNGREDSIHWKNVQLYVSGLTFGVETGGGGERLVIVILYRAIRGQQNIRPHILTPRACFVQIGTAHAPSKRRRVISRTTERL